ncbi:MAG TPA: hypothetical protein VGO67_19405 [Verrucomicrobiae bacterium]
MKNDVFLQDIVVLERSLAGFKNMNPAKFKVGQETLAEGSKIRSVTETPGRNPDELASWNEQTLNQRYKPCIKIACLDPCLTEAAPFDGIGPDFSIGRIYNRSIEHRRLGAKEVFGQMD